MIQFFKFFGWLACVVYSTIPCFWFLVHPWAEYWRSRRKSPYQVLLPAWVAMWIIVALVTVRWRHLVLYSSWWPWLPALGLFGAGLWLYAHSSKNFSARQLGGVPEVVAGHAEQRLVTTGIRAHVRHPVYLAHLCEMLAWSLGTGLAVCYGLTAFAVLTGAVMIRMEDRELGARFGEEYRRYRARVPAVLLKCSMTLSGADRKPRGWLAIGIFLLWGACMATLAGTTLIFPGTFLDRVWVLNPKGHAGLAALGRWAGFLFPVLGLLLAMAGIGWLKRRSWGWVLAVLLIGGNALGDAIRMVSGAWLEGAVGVVIAGALFLYIISPGVRDYFG